MLKPSIYQDWLSSIDLAKTRVVRFPSLVFLCGGEVSNNGGCFKSCRDIFYNHISRPNCPFRDQVILAEKVFNYFQHSEYQDLLRFERDLAELSVLTVIFSESPGSIAELGTFAVLETVRDKLLVVIHGDDAEKESFIWRGPVSHIRTLSEENEKHDPVAVYSWRRRTNSGDILTAVDFADAQDLEERIEEIISRTHKSEALNKTRLGHIMLLMLDMLKVVQIANLDQISDFLSLLGIDHIHTTVAQRLSLLCSLKLAVKFPYRNNVYYLSANQLPWLTWRFTAQAKIRDTNRWKSRFVEHYSLQDEQKSRALRSYLSSQAQDGA